MRQRARVETDMPLRSILHHALLAPLSLGLTVAIARESSAQSASGSESVRSAPAIPVLFEEARV